MEARIEERLNTDAGSGQSNPSRSDPPDPRRYASIKRRIRERIRAKKQAKLMMDGRERIAGSGICGLLFLALALLAVTPAIDWMRSPTKHKSCA